VEEQVDGPGPAGRWEVWAGSTGILASMDVGRLGPPLEEEGDAGSVVSEWELREQQEWPETTGAVEEEGEELPLSLPTPSFVASEGEE